jgi:DNA-binding MarR family transcriptional regulator
MSTPVNSGLAEAVERLVAALVRQPRMPGDSGPGELSTFQGIMLALLVDQGPHRLGALAAALGTTDATASRNADVLERLGLVRRVPDDADGRGVLVSATGAGLRSVRARRARLRRLASQLVEQLGPEDGPRLVELLTELRELLAGPPGGRR